MALKLWSGHDFNTYYYRAHNSVKNICDVRVLVLCTLPEHDLHTYQVSRNYLERFQSYGADTISILIIIMGHNSVKRYVELQFLFSAHRLLHYIVPSVML